MNAEDLKARVLPTLLSGTRRDGLDEHLSFLGTDRDQATLNALSLTGQAMRFTRSSAPKEYAVESWPKDERAIVAEELRAPILRLLDKCTDDTARALALALEVLRLRPHPFDLPRLDGFVREYSEYLGVTAQYWLLRQTPSANGFLDADQLSKENWADAPLRLRMRFLRELRARDPGEARRILEKSWENETPTNRIRLVSILQNNLSTDDRQFLESIQKDRAQRARPTIQRLLAKILGPSFDNPFVATCMQWTQKSKSGLLKKRNVLKLELPLTVKETDLNRWIHEQFVYVTLDELARACDITETRLIEAAGGDNNLLFALALMASREKRFELLATVTDEIPDAWLRMSIISLEETFSDDADERAQWAAALIKPEKWLPETHSMPLSWLHQQMEGPLPAGVMREVLHSSMWTAQQDNEKKGGSEIVQAMCALCPAELRQDLRAQIEPLNAERKEKGLMLLEILDTLERSK